MFFSLLCGTLLKIRTYAMNSQKETQPKRTKIIIVEDDRYLREGWKTVLDFEKNFSVIGTFNSCEKAFESDCIEQADVVLQDIGLPGISGIDAIPKMLKRNNELLIIMATVFEDDQNIYDSLANGAIGYLQKKVSPPELVDAIKLALEGGSPMSPAVARKVITSFQKKRKQEKIEKLTNRELSILRELSRGKSYKNIADDIYLSVDGVRYHIRNIYRKLQVSSRTEAVSKAIFKKLIKPDE